MHHHVWGKIIYPFPNFNVEAVIFGNVFRISPHTMLASGARSCLPVKSPAILGKWYLVVTFSHTLPGDPDAFDLNYGYAAPVIILCCG